MDSISTSGVLVSFWEAGIYFTSPLYLVILFVRSNTHYCSLKAIKSLGTYGMTNEIIKYDRNYDWNTLKSLLLLLLLFHLLYFFFLPLLFPADDLKLSRGDYKTDWKEKHLPSCHFLMQLNRAYDADDDPMFALPAIQAVSYLRREPLFLSQLLSFVPTTCYVWMTLGKRIKPDMISLC